MLPVLTRGAFLGSRTEYPPRLPGLSQPACLRTRSFTPSRRALTLDETNVVAKETSVRVPGGSRGWPCVLVAPRVHCQIFQTIRRGGTYPVRTPKSCQLSRHSLPREICTTLQFTSSHLTSYLTCHTDSHAERTLEPSQFWAHGRMAAVSEPQPSRGLHSTAPLVTRTPVGGVQTQAMACRSGACGSRCFSMTPHNDPVSNDLAGSTNRPASSVTTKATAGPTANHAASDLSPT